jgi:hypothetical protein
MVLELATICAFELEIDGGGCFYHCSKLTNFHPNFGK